MGKLMDHNTMIPTTNSSKVIATVSSSKLISASKHHVEDVQSRGLNQAKAGMGSDRLPDGSLDTSRNL